MAKMPRKEFIMTEREMLAKVIANEVDDEVIAKAQAMVDSLNARNEKRKNTPSKNAIANAPLYDLIAEVVKGADKPLTADEIFAEVSTKTDLEITLPKIRAIAVRMATNGTLVKGTQEGVAKSKAKATFTFAD